MNVCLEKFEQKAVVNEGNDDRGETLRMSSGGESDILNEALELSQAMGKLQIVSKEFESAMPVREQPMRFVMKGCIFKTEFSQRNFASFLRFWNVSTILTQRPLRVCCF